MPSFQPVLFPMLSDAFLVEAKDTTPAMADAMPPPAMPPQKPPQKPQSFGPEESHRLVRGDANLGQAISEFPVPFFLGSFFGFCP